MYRTALLEASCSGLTASPLTYARMVHLILQERYQQVPKDVVLEGRGVRGSRPKSGVQATTGSGTGGKGVRCTGSVSHFYPCWSGMDEVIVSRYQEGQECCA